MQSYYISSLTTQLSPINDRVSHNNYNYTTVNELMNNVRTYTV